MAVVTSVDHNNFVPRLKCARNLNENKGRSITVNANVQKYFGIRDYLRIHPVIPVLG
jgi:hypothetical protein